MASQTGFDPCHRVSSVGQKITVSQVAVTRSQRDPSNEYCTCGSPDDGKKKSFSSILKSSSFSKERIGGFRLHLRSCCITVSCVSTWSVWCRRLKMGPFKILLRYCITCFHMQNLMQKTETGPEIAFVQSPRTWYNRNEYILGFLGNQTLVWTDIPPKYIFHNMTRMVLWNNFHVADSCLVQPPLIGLNSMITCVLFEKCWSSKSFIDSLSIFPRSFGLN